MACVFLELGQEVHIQGDFEQAVHEGVRRGYGEGYLRKSIVGDPLRRVNTEDNTPRRHHPPAGAWGRVPDHRGSQGLRLENMSRLGMLKPADGVEGVKKFVVETVRLAGSNPCPPIVLGIGIGGSFDKAAYLAKHALPAPSTSPTPTPFYAQLEEELLEEINALGIGPQGFGGRTTCLGLSIETAPHPRGRPARGGECELPCDPPGLRPALTAHGGVVMDEQMVAVGGRALQVSSVGSGPVTLVILSGSNILFPGLEYAPLADALREWYSVLILQIRLWIQ